MAYRDDLPAAQARIEQLERENGELREELRARAAEIEELTNKSDVSVDFFLGYTEDQVRELATENKELHQKILMLREMPVDLVLAQKEFRRDMRRAQKLFVVIMIIYLLAVNGWLPLIGW